MTQAELVEHLKDHGCNVVRQDSKGYFVMRSSINGEVSGVPVASSPSGCLRPFTVCQICNKLGVEIHEDGAIASGVVNHVNKKFIRQAE